MKKSILTVFYVLLMHTVFSQQKLPVRNIEINATATKGKLNTMFNECIGAGRANEGLRADWQQQLLKAKQECGFRYIRFHGLLTDDMGVYREDRHGNPQYNYMYIDALFDYLLSIHIKPFVELGFMPDALASGNDRIFWWRGNVTPPKDYDKWAALIKNLTTHFTERYGADEVKTWYFEVWNEPNLSPGFWSGTQHEYFKLYQYAAQAVKSVNKNYRVGGPATAGTAWVPEMIAFCKEHNVPIDFISTHSYGVKQGFLDEFGQTGTVLNKDDMAVSCDVMNTRKQIEASPFSGLELHYTEWSSSYTPADPIHDSYHQAAYILQKIRETGNAAQSMSYWVFTDIFEEAGIRFEPFHGGFGLMNIQGIAKPAYFAYKYMHQLGKTELQNNDAASWVCADENGNLQLLLWDFSHTLPDDSVNNQQYYVRDLPALPKGSVNITINGLSKGKYQLEVYKTGYRANDAHTAYIDLGRPNQLSKQEVEKLKEISSDKPVIKENFSLKKNQSFSRTFEMRENDVFLIKILK